ncbi:hypothetical protein EV702DRAFT_1047390 [Suillus placidus]|uniref:Protein-S-isoprenylcysteine O-methyltransferase n=1 Tax=Suillus placidus TaxID=48579 RepID=A0A9P6ZQZ0_9AGAM|nr:hypothetical protein EV702DRAFT_1047390 [Suillus placidus]
MYPTSTQAVEGLAVLTTLQFFHYGISRTRAIALVAKAEAGSIRTMPTSFVGQIVSPIQGLASFIPPLMFLGSTFTHLGNQWHLIGRREKPKVMQTGPYAVMRHPLYTNMLIQEALFALMFWSYAPLVGLGITAGAFAVKMPIEEDLIMKDPAVAAEYRAYMQRVPARVIPYLW